MLVKSPPLSPEMAPAGRPMSMVTRSSAAETRAMRSDSPHSYPLPLHPPKKPSVLAMENPSKKLNRRVSAFLLFILARIDGKLNASRGRLSPSEQLGLIAQDLHQSTVSVVQFDYLKLRNLACDRAHKDIIMAVTRPKFLQVCTLLAYVLFLSLRLLISDSDPVCVHLDSCDCGVCTEAMPLWDMMVRCARWILHLSTPVLLPQQWSAAVGSVVMLRAQWESALAW